MEPRHALPPAGERRSLRVQAGLTLREAAMLLGVCARTVLRWEQADCLPAAANRRRYARQLERWQEEQGSR